MNKSLKNALVAAGLITMVTVSPLYAVDDVTLPVEVPTVDATEQATVLDHEPLQTRIHNRDLTQDRLQQTDQMADVDAIQNRTQTRAMIQQQLPLDGVRPESTQRPESAGRPEFAGRPDSSNRPEGINRPEMIERPQMVDRPKMNDRPERSNRPRG
jgi:hypothetical protein